MKARPTILQDESGSAIVMALMILVLLTLLGVISTNTNVTEQQIVRNEAIYTRNFYRAEGASTEAAMLLENHTFGDILTTLFTDYQWVSNRGDSFADGGTDTADGDGDGFIGLADTDNWLDTGGSVTGDVSASALNTNSYYAALYLTTEGSLKPNSPKTHIFRTYGYCVDEGESLVATGYRKAVN